MNFLYFACSDCKISINAGNRWAYLELEEAGLVKCGEQANIERVQAAEKYWNPPIEESSRWLYEEIFPPLKLFLEEHKKHRVIFGEQDSFVSLDTGDFWNWLQIGYLLTPMPRYFVDVLGYKTWNQVEAYINQQENIIWWLDDENSHENSKRKFAELVSQHEPQ